MVVRGSIQISLVIIGHFLQFQQEVDVFLFITVKSEHRADGW